MPGVGRTDEVHDLLKTCDVPHRFVKHVPRFRLIKKPVVIDTHIQKEGEPREVEGHFFMDGDRHVAMWTRETDRIDLMTWNPLYAVTNLALPARYHFARLFGPSASTTPWVFGAGDEHSVEFSPGGETITMKISRTWTKEMQGEVSGSFTLRLDPHLGYVVEADYSYRVNKKRDRRFEYMNVMFVNIADPWPGSSRWDRTFYSPMGKPGYVAWANNWVAGERSDGSGIQVRRDGIVGLVDEGGGWGIFIVRDGDGPFCNSTCNVWLDQHNQLTPPQEPDADGFYTMRWTTRVGYLPPELTQHVNTNTTMLFEGQTAVMPRLGVHEDFETQPQPLTSPGRGLRYDGVRLARDRTRSGRQAVLVQAHSDPKTRGVFSIAPQVPLEADATYAVECWVFVEGEDTQAEITLDLYRANVHWPPRIRRQQTNTAGPGDEWQKIELTFDTKGIGYDPFVDFRFRVIGAGKAYFDDLYFRQVK
jgi:hypothetical protein